VYAIACGALMVDISQFMWRLCAETVRASFKYQIGCRATSFRCDILVQAKRGYFVHETVRAVCLVNQYTINIYLCTTASHSTFCNFS